MLLEEPLHEALVRWLAKHPAVIAPIAIGTMLGTGCGGISSAKYRCSARGVVLWHDMIRW
jgi:hypothetical protein